MKKKKITFLVVAVGLIVAALIATYFTSVFADIPKPEIKEGEFDFALTYEVDGERKKIEGTYVCKYKGVIKNIDGVGRKWKGYIKDHDDFTDYEIKTTDEGTIKIDLDISSAFFMSDPTYQLTGNTDNPKPEPYIYIVSGDPAKDGTLKPYEGDDVKIISLEYDPPIENTYK
jgi:hypothetical protein